MSDPKDTKAETGEGDYDPDLGPDYDNLDPDFDTATEDPMQREHDKQMARMARAIRKKEQAALKAPPVAQQKPEPSAPAADDKPQATFDEVFSRLFTIRYPMAPDGPQHAEPASSPQVTPEPPDEEAALPGETEEDRMDRLYGRERHSSERWMVMARRRKEREELGLPTTAEDLRYPLPKEATERRPTPDPTGTASATGKDHKKPAKGK